MVFFGSGVGGRCYGNAADVGWETSSSMDTESAFMSYLDHCGVYVKDLERSVAFYRDIFGWREKKRFGSGDAKICVLDMTKGLLELVQRPGSPGIPPSGNWTHLAIHVEDWDATSKKLEGKGLELRKVTMGDGSHIAFFKDPDGHTVEVMEKGLSIID